MYFDISMYITIDIKYFTFTPKPLYIPFYKKQKTHKIPETTRKNHRISPTTIICIYTPYGIEKEQKKT